MRPSASTVITLSPIASRVAMARGFGEASVGMTPGIISSAVSSNAGSPELSITVVESSTRVTWPCRSISSTS